LIYGTSPAFCDWKYLSRKTRVRVPNETIGGEVTGYREVKNYRKVIANNPVAGVIDIFRYFQCPNTVESPTSSDGVLFAGYEFQKSYEELLIDAKNGIYIESEVKKLHDINNNPVDSQENRLLLLNKTSMRHDMYNARNMVDAIHYYGLVPDKNGDLVFKHVTVAFPSGLPVKGPTEGIIIRDEDDPLHINRIPITLVRTNLMPGELYGVGDIQMVESLQIELNDQRNQRCDNVVRSMNQMWKVKSGLDIDEAMLQYRPNGIIEVEDTNDITPLVPNMLQLNQSMSEEAVIKQDIQFASGVSDFIAGTFQNTTGFNDTATGISLIQAAAQGRIILKAQFLQTAIKELAETVWALDQQHLPFNTVLKVLDPFSASKFRFIRASPNLINGQYDFSIVSAPSTGNPQVRRQQLIQVIQVLTQIMPIAAESGQPVKIDYSNLVLRILREFNIPNIAEVFPQLVNSEQINNLPSFINDALSNGESMDPELENQIVSDGGDIKVNPGDDDLTHIISHQEAANIATGQVKTKLMEHNQKHSEQMELKRALILTTTRNNAQNVQAGNGQGSDLMQELLQQNGASKSPDDAGGNESLIRNLANESAISGV
jgi:hypothetical protein